MGTSNSCVIDSFPQIDVLEYRYISFSKYIKQVAFSYVYGTYVEKN